MPLANFSKLQSNTPKDTYVEIKTGKQTIVQILDKEAVELHRHWVVDGSGKRFSVRCIGPSCPYCVRNASVGYNRDHPDYVPIQRRYAINVLDLTPARLCPSCGTANPAGAQFCESPTCHADLREVEPAPLKKVKILERGRRLFEQLSALEGMPNPMAGGKMVPIQNYPIMLVANGEGTDMTILTVPLPPNDINPDEWEKLDPSKSFTLTVDELKYLMSGGVLSDILAQRRASRDTAQPKVTEEEVPF